MASYSYKLENSKDFAYIKTLAKNVKAKVINNELSATSEYGINGTFFSRAGGRPGDKDFTMPNAVGICWVEGAKTEGSTVLPADYAKVDYWESNLNNSGKISRGSFTITDTSEGYKCAVYTNSTATGIRNSISNCKVIIGGGHLQLLNSQSVFDSTFANEKWDSTVNPQSTDRRTGLGFKVEKNSQNVNEWHVYLVISKTKVTLYQLRNYMKDTLGCYDGIFLDGGGSTQMRCAEDVDRGSDQTIFTAGRVLSNAIVLVSKT